MDRNESGLEMGASRKRLSDMIFLAKAAHEAEEFEDMYGYVKEMIDAKLELNVDFDIDERNLISVGFRNYLGKLQTAVRIMAAIGKQEKYQKFGALLPDMENK